MNFICGQTFVNLADFIFTVEDRVDDWYKFPNTFTVEAVHDSTIETPVIFTNLSNINEMFDQLGNVKRNVVLITHLHDVAVTEKFYSIMPSNIIKWYSQNVNYLGEKLESVPIGIEHLQRMQFHGMDKRKKMVDKLSEPKKHRNLLYVRHSVWTNKRERYFPYVYLKDKPFATVQIPQIFSFDESIDNIYNHKFMLCPEGNGIDTFRKWECLYLNTIPIEKRNINNTFYQDLPICFVDDWEEITKDFLNKEYDRIMSSKWNLEKLTPEFWTHKILSSR